MGTIVVFLICAALFFRAYLVVRTCAAINILDCRFKEAWLFEKLYNVSPENAVFGAFELDVALEVFVRVITAFFWN